MPKSHRSPSWPNALVLILCLLSPPLGLLGWVFGNSAQRSAYLRSWWVRAGLALLVLGSAPLLAIGVAAKIGLWPDPNPNPIGLGLLFVFSALLATGCLIVGVLLVWLKLRQTAL